jgi:hypothetical protein
LKKIAPKSFGQYFSEKNVPNAKKYCPKWQNFAQSGHTGPSIAENTGELSTWSLCLHV